MLLNRNHKFLFIHIQRTGGSSLRKVLTEAFSDTESFLGSHDHAVCAKPHLGSSWSNYYKIAFVRNPWERIFSWYTMITQTQQGNIATWYKKDVLGEKPRNRLWEYVFNHSTNFEEFLLNCTDVIDDVDGRKSFAYNQLDYLTDEQGNLLVDFIGRHENYTQDAHILFQHLGLGQIQLPHVWPSKHHHYSQYYTEKTANLVAKRFAKDIAFFGYQFKKI